MRKKLLLLSLAILALLAANLKLCCRVTVDGTRLDALYRPDQVREGQRIAREAAEEILSDSARLPDLRRSYRLRLRRADGPLPLLTDALLNGVDGVTRADAVFINGVPLGTVADGAQLLDRLHASIRGQMPNAAIVGNLSGELQIHPVYTRSGGNPEDADMILLITGMAPVVYLNENGRVV